MAKKQPTRKKLPSKAETEGQGKIASLVKNLATEAGEAKQQIEAEIAELRAKLKELEAQRDQIDSDVQAEIREALASVGIYMERPSSKPTSSGSRGKKRRTKQEMEEMAEQVLDVFRSSDQEWLGFADLKIKAGLEKPDLKATMMKLVREERLISNEVRGPGGKYRLAS